MSMYTCSCQRNKGDPQAQAAKPTRPAPKPQPCSGKQQGPFLTPPAPGLGHLAKQGDSTYHINHCKSQSHLPADTYFHSPVIR